MSYFQETGRAFRNQVETLSRVADDSLIQMMVNGVSVNILKTPDMDRQIMTATNYIEVKECSVDALRDDFRFWDGCVWKGIRALGLYDKLVNPSARDQRPEVKIGAVTYQIFAMDDDVNDATVKLTLRRKQ